MFCQLEAPEKFGLRFRESGSSFGRWTAPEQGRVRSPCRDMFSEKLHCCVVWPGILFELLATRDVVLIPFYNPKMKVFARLFLRTLKLYNATHECVQAKSDLFDVSQCRIAGQSETYLFRTPLEDIVGHGIRLLFFLFELHDAD